MATRGIQYIIDNAAAIEFGRAKTVGQIVVRSGRIRAAERASTTPWQMIVTPPTYAKYEDVRDAIEGVTIIDRNTYFWIDFSTTNLNYITEYRGDMTTTQQNALRITTASNWVGNAVFDINYVAGNNGDVAGYSSTSTFDYMRLTNLPSLGSTGTNGVITTSSVLFKAGDWVQFRTDRISGTDVANRGLARTVPLDVLRGSGSTVDVPVHRPFVWNGTQTYAVNYRAGGDISIGSDVRLGMVVTKMPSWKLLPGKIVQWTGDFELYEYIAG